MTRRPRCLLLLLPGVSLLGAGCPEPQAPSLFEPTPAQAASPPAGPATALRFEDGTAASGVSFRHHGGRHEAKWLPETMGAGVAIVDLNRDGAPDLLLVDSGSLLDDAPPDAGPRLYLNDGAGRFTDVTAAWGLTRYGYGMGVAVGDVDGDGWTDVYLTTWEGTDRLLRNVGGERFEDVTEAWAVAPSGWTTSAAFFDLENDGDLDLYALRYVDYPLQDAIKCWFRSIHIYCTPTLYEALPDRLLVNEGGRFVDASDRIKDHYGKGLALATGDLDQDGDTDIYVADDITRNLLLLNDGAGGFVERGQMAGVAYSEVGREEASMGVAVSDFDADGRPDVAVTNFQGESTNLYSPGATGLYREKSDAVGIGRTARARLAFGIEFFDGDNDGDEELLTANGHVTDNVGEYRDGVTFAQANSLYENRGDGTMPDVSAAAGPALQDLQVSRGLAVGDLDGDGGLDFVFVNNEGTAQVGINSGPRGHWLNLWLEGSSSNRSAIGAVVTARIGDRTISREVRGASSYLSQSDKRVHLGLGAATSIDELAIAWPGGERQVLTEVAGDRFLRMVQGGAPVAYTPGAAAIAP